MSEDFQRVKKLLHQLHEEIWNHSEDGFTNMFLSVLMLFPSLVKRSKELKLDDAFEHAFTSFSEIERLSDCIIMDGHMSGAFDSLIDKTKSKSLAGKAVSDTDFFAATLGLLGMYVKFKEVSDDEKLNIAETLTTFTSKYLDNTILKIDGLDSSLPINSGLSLILASLKAFPIKDRADYVAMVNNAIKEEIEL